MKVLITGVAGYIGSILARQLLEKGYAVRGFDSLMYGGTPLLGIYGHPRFEFMKGDLCIGTDLTRAVSGVDAVVHLAAIVGDPACAKQPDLATRINWEASKHLLDACNADGSVKRFIFASTCSNYGKMKANAFVDERSELLPVSLYARLKVQFEEYLLNFKTNGDLVPTALRFATVYGTSPRMRFDLTVNEFVRDAVLGRKIKIFGKQFWRPYCHVEDLARACVLTLESEAKKVAHNVFNVGDTNENFQKGMIIERIGEVMPWIDVEYVHKEEDPRDYKVNFSKVNSELGFRICRNLTDGIKQVRDVLRDRIIVDPDDDKYRNS